MHEHDEAGECGCKDDAKYQGKMKLELLTAFLGIQISNVSDEADDRGLAEHHAELVEAAHSETIDASRHGTQLGDSCKIVWLNVSPSREGRVNMPPDAMPLEQQERFPSPTLPVLFADIVTSYTNSPQIVKFYLARIDPSLTGDGSTKIQVATQVIAPVAGFVHIAAFFNAAVNNMIKKGTISTADWESAQQEQSKAFK